MRGIIKRKTSRCVISAFLLAGLLAFLIPMGTYADEDDEDNSFTMWTYSDLSKQERKELLTTTGSSTIMNFSYQFYALNPEAEDIGLPNVRVGADEKEIYSYAKQVRRAKTYFRKLRNLSDVTQGWYVAYVREDEEGQYAVAGYGGNSRGVHVPAHLDGYEVRGIDITNHHLAKLDLGNHVQYIYGCKSGYLKWLEGCDEVKYIGSRAFENCVSLKKLPLMEKLETISSLAFMGCLSLQEVPLGDEITWITPDAFGWYDVVLGNYDFPGLNDDFTYFEGFMDNDRIYGITLYAKENSPTHWLLDNLYGYHYVEGMTEEEVEFFAGHVSYADMSLFAGVEEEPYVEESWTYYPWCDFDKGTGTAGGNGDKKQPVAETKPANTAGVDEKQLSGVDYFFDLFQKGMITANVLLAAMFALAGFNVPSWLANDVKNAGMDIAGQIRETTEKYAKLSEPEKIEKLSILNGYLSAIAGFADEKGLLTSKLGSSYGTIINMTSALLKGIDLVQKGEPLDQAFSKAMMSLRTGKAVDAATDALIAKAATSAAAKAAQAEATAASAAAEANRLAAIAKATGGAAEKAAAEAAASRAVTAKTAAEIAKRNLNPLAPLKYWDVIVMVSLGGSDAADVAGIGSNAEHLVDYLYDLSVAVRAKDSAKAVAELSQKALENGAYGKNIQTLLQLSEFSVFDIDDVCIGMREMGTRKFLENICQSVNETFVDKNYVGEFFLKGFNSTIQSLAERGYL